jgi:alcohol dehydrogenase (cytochrome c)
VKPSAKIVVSALAIIIVGGLGIALSKWSPLTLLTMTLNSVRSATNAPGTLTVELNPGFTGSGTQRAQGESAQSSDGGSWPSYNRTLTSERYSPLDTINARTVHDLKVLCSYDTRFDRHDGAGHLLDRPQQLPRELAYSRRL